MRVQSHKSHTLRYVLTILWFIWILLLWYLFYEYLVSKTDQAPTKGWTLIEWVTAHITYLPYVGNSSQDRFYQNLLFKSCQSFSTTWWQVVYEPDLCDVISNDNKTYVVSINTTGTWSDKAPISIDDLIFTYTDILQNNIWALPHGDAYKDLVIQKLSNNSLTITFPRASPDNMQFFTNFIVPSHILAGKNWDYYIKNFGATPVTNSCATLSQSRDADSLIFDLIECPQTWLKYYQVKNTTLEKTTKDPWIVDLYIWPWDIPWYNTGTIITNDYAWVFFNMKTGKLGIYGRKNIIALLNKYLYLPENNLPIIKEHFLFDSYATTVSDKSTITLLGSWQEIERPWALPERITITNDTRDQAYSVEYFDHPTQLKIEFTTDKLPTAVATNIGIPMTFKTNGKQVTIVFEDNWNIFPWLNTVFFTDENGTTISSLDIYYKTVAMIWKSGRINIVYNARDTVNNHIATIMRNITLQEWLSDYVYFLGTTSTQKLTDTLINKEYDITISNISLWVKKDISTMFLVDDPLSNPSLYINGNMATQIKNYFQSSLQTQYSIKPVIDKLYSTDLPFFMIGKRISYIHLKPSISLPDVWRWDEATARYKLLNSLVIVHKPQVTKWDILNIKKFITFIYSEITH